MNRTAKIMGVGTLACAFLFLSSAIAVADPSGTPAGFGKGQKEGWNEGTNPPGWSQGDKKGWDEAGSPPGLAKKI